MVTVVPLTTASRPTIRGVESEPALNAAKPTPLLLPPVALGLRLIWPLPGVEPAATTP